MKCLHCGKEIADSARFCPYCGSKQPIEKHCPHCGATLNPEAKFCPHCGQAVSLAADAPANPGISAQGAAHPNQPISPAPAAPKPKSRKVWVIVLMVAVLIGGLWYAYSEYGFGRSIIGAIVGDSVPSNSDESGDSGEKKERSAYVNKILADLVINEYGFLGLSIQDGAETLVNKMCNLDEENFDPDPNNYQYAASLNIFLNVGNNPVSVAAIFREPVAEQAMSGDYTDSSSPNCEFKSICAQYITFVLTDKHLDGQLADLYDAVAERVRGYGSVAAQNDNVIVVESESRTYSNGYICYIVVNTGDCLAFYVGHFNTGNITTAPFQGASKDNPVALSNLSLDNAL